jgi:molybdopterin biosynthesis enzyme
MKAQTETTQRIARLTPLREALATIDAVAPVPPRSVEPAAALGRILAADVIAVSGRPVAALALRDGWAVPSDALVDASGYAPAPLAAMPKGCEIGDPLPPATDAIADLDAVVVNGPVAEAVAPVAPGEGVLAAQADARKDAVLRMAGSRLRGCDVAAFAALGIGAVSVREPRLRVVLAGRPGEVSRAGCAFLAAAIQACGGVAILDHAGSAGASLFAAALKDGDADAVIAVGGTGSGRSDASVQTLATLGELRFHGLALSPGETTAFGFVGRQPVLLVPGRIDAALAVWLLLGQRLLERLTGAVASDASASFALTRKVASTVGITTVVPVRRRDDAVEPLASGYLPLQSLTQADGWIVVAAESEGYPQGARVAVRALP